MGSAAPAGGASGKGSPDPDLERMMAAANATYRRAADQMTPRLRVLLNSGDPPALSPYVVPWVVYSLWAACKIGRKTTAPLSEVVGYADAYNHAIVMANELAAGFLALRARGWLVERDGEFGMAAEGLTAIDGLTQDCKDVFDAMERVGKFLRQGA